MLIVFAKYKKTCACKSYKPIKKCVCVVCLYVACVVYVAYVFVYMRECVCIFMHECINSI